MAPLELQGLCKGFDHPVLDRLSLAVASGEFFVVVGPSGIGKTTLLRCVAGLEQPDAGRVLIDGEDVTRTPPYRRPVAMTFESYALYPHLTVFENIASPLRARKLDPKAIRERVERTARLLRIETLLERRPGEISGGQKQRTALGRTLVAEPKVFLLDEPLSHLDAKIRHELRQQFHRLDELRRTATLYVTHDYAEALALGDRIGVMGRGGLVQTGSPRQVFEQPSDIFVARHLGQPTINELQCSLMQSDAALFAVPTGQRFAIPVAPRHGARLPLRDGPGGGTVVLGVRPQDIRVMRNGEPLPPGLHPLEAAVDLFEALGATGVLIADAGELRLTCLTSVERSFEPGQPVRLALDPERFLFFSPADGASLLH
jgi:multiple sugar transport system ATP-binding protein